MCVLRVSQGETALYVMALDRKQMQCVCHVPRCGGVPCGVMRCGGMSGCDVKLCDVAW